MHVEEIVKDILVKEGLDGKYAVDDIINVIPAAITDESVLRESVLAALNVLEDGNDFSKWKNFFRSMSIEFKLRKVNECHVLTVDHKHLDTCYGANLDLVFESSGKFICFETSGE